MEGNWNGAQGNNKYQYNQKEWNDDFGLGWNDYGARFYDPAIGRFWGIDMLAEADLHHTPYSYAGNNPYNDIDILGLTNKGVGDDENILPKVEIVAPRPARVVKETHNLIDVAQYALSIGEFIPGVQTVAGLANAGIYALRGDYTSAALSLGSSIPIAGYLFKGAKVAKVLSAAAPVVINMTKINTAIANARRIRGALRVASGKYASMVGQANFQKHHLIPRSLSNRFKNQFSAAGFDVDVDNIVQLPEHFHAKHPKYTKYVERELMKIIGASNGSISIGQIQQLQRDLLSKIDDALDNYINTGGAERLNDFF